MWKCAKMPLSLAVFVPTWAVLGGWSTLDTGAPTWWGVTGGEEPSEEDEQRASGNQERC
jgi:hypothetical protein